MTRIQQKIKKLDKNAHCKRTTELCPFITTWNMTSGEVSRLLTQTGTYNATIDWGDGTSSTHTTGVQHIHTHAGQYQIKINRAI